MLPPSYLDRMPDAFVQLWQQVEEQILQDVARRIGKMDTVTPTANWQLWRYQQTEALRNDVVKLLARYSGKSETAIRKLLLQAATEAMEREDAIYYHYDMEPTPFEESAALNNLLDAGARQTCGTWQNLTATTANTVTGAFERTLDAAWLKVSTGAVRWTTRAGTTRILKPQPATAREQGFAAGTAATPFSRCSRSWATRPNGHRNSCRS